MVERVYFHLYQEEFPYIFCKIWGLVGGLTSCSHLHLHIIEAAPFFFFLGLKLSSEAGTLLSDMVFFFLNTAIIVDSMAQPYEASDESDSPQIKSASWLLPQL